MLLKCFTSSIIYLKRFGFQTSKNIQDIQKFVFRRASVSFYVFLVCACCLKSKNIKGYPWMLIDMLRVKTFWYNSLRTTLRSPKEDPNVEEVGDPWQRAVKRHGNHPRVARLERSVTIRSTPKNMLTSSKINWGKIKACLHDTQSLPWFGCVAWKSIWHV